MNKRTIKITFLISFISVVIFCLLAIVGIYLYKFINKKIIEAKNEKNYKECLVEQQKADKIALSYMPIISFIDIDSSVRTNIEGRIPGFKDIAKLDIEFEKPDKGCINKVIDYNQKNGNFTIKASGKEGINKVNCWYNNEIEMRFILEPYDKEKIAIPIPNSRMQDGSFSFNLNWIYIRKFIDSDKWCLGGKIDIGLGSAPTWELTDEELTQTGLTKDKVCATGYRSERPAIENKYREKKCSEYIRKIPTETRYLMKIL